MQADVLRCRPMGSIAEAFVKQFTIYLASNALEPLSGIGPGPSHSS
jgi:hypothetical protein